MAIPLAEVEDAGKAARRSRRPPKEGGGSTSRLRSELALAMMRRASAGVVRLVTLDSMEKSFPDLLTTDEDRAFVHLLTQKTVEHLDANFEQAWIDILNNSTYKDFEVKAGEVDRAQAEAVQRREAREPPLDAWRAAADPVLAIEAEMLPRLQTHSDNLLSLSTQLSGEADKALQSLIDRKAEADAIEREIASMLASIKEGTRNLDTVDQEAIRQLSDSIIPLISTDKL